MSEPDEAPEVPWIIGTRTALSRVVALAIAEARGEAWDRLPPGMRRSRVTDAGRHLDEAVANRAAVTFLAPWREPT